MFSIKNSSRVNSQRVKLTGIPSTGAGEILQPDITSCGGLTAGRRIRELVKNTGLILIPHRGGSLWGLPVALTASTCSMAEEFPSGSPILDAMTPLSDSGDYIAPTAPGFGTNLSEQMLLGLRHPETF